MSTVMMPTTAAPTVTGNWLTQTWRLARWFWYASRRRLMGKVLLVILAAGLVVVLGFVLIAYVAISNSPPQANVCPPAPVQTQAAQNGDTSGEGGCFQMDQQELDQARAQWQREVAVEQQALTFPNVLSTAGGYTAFMGLILLVILAGSIVGGEYGTGTVRLSLTRGVGRGQLIAAQVVAIALLALITMGITLAIGAIFGLTLGPAIGGKIPAFPAGGALEILGYWVLLSFQIFAYALIGLFMGTLARSTAAAIAVPLGFYMFETIVGNILVALGSLMNTDFGHFLGHVPEWFLGNNVATLSTNAAQSPLDLGVSTSALQVQVSTEHALIVSLAYCVVLIALSYMILRGRDVTD